MRVSGGVACLPMRCPECGHESSRVVDSRPADDGAAIRRRRQCESCEGRFTTYERMESVRKVRKRSGFLQPFDPSKLRAGLESALADRPVSQPGIDDLVESIEATVLAGSGPIASSEIGSLVLRHLKELDAVAYLRFASVYEDFEGAEDFEQALADLGERVDVSD